MNELKQELLPDKIYVRAVTDKTLSAVRPESPIAQAEWSGRLKRTEYVRADRLSAPSGVKKIEGLAGVGKMVVPDGYKLVPIEPTKKMLKAAWKAQYIHVGGLDKESDKLADRRVNDIEQRKQDVIAYKAMLAAAPTPAPTAVDLDALKRLLYPSIPRTYEDAIACSTIDRLAAKFDFVRKV